MKIPPSSRNSRANTTPASNPKAPEERDILDTLITAVWQLRRLRRVENQIWARAMNETRISKPVKWTPSETYAMNDRLFQRLQSRRNAAERTFRRCLQDPKRLQTERMEEEERAAWGSAFE